ncbi:MAG: 1-deoxy-D-xylulose-5-phosphate reductoisomerase [Candidatus Omnitrophica bacterium]|nr:1-deoxy-D-xylulose-5-phosphate reductoisomerase [Candidatus Omnitrophota bacterium]
MKNIAILGSTGSVGENTLKVIRNFPDKFKVTALSANADIDKLSRQIKEFAPACVCVNDKARALALSKMIKPGVKVFTGSEGLEALVKDKRIDQVMFAISGSPALAPLLSAIDSGKDIALANKEALVMAGPLITRLSARKKVRIIPVDSEQSAIWQCLKDEDRGSLKNIYLTASGGPLRKLSKQALKRIRLKEVLAHPRWKMGKKISVDSATLMNKGLELLEAMFLFGVDVPKIKVLVHPEALVHSMVEFIDGVIIAQLSVTDMRIPIQYALAYPERLRSPLGGIDFCKVGGLHFEKPDCLKFPCLSLAYEAARELGTLPCVLNAANEVAVAEFLKEKLKFMHIAEVVQKVMRAHRNKPNPVLGDIWEADKWARVQARKVMARLN